MPRSTDLAAPAPSPWDLDRCPATRLAQRGADLQAFVAWLRDQDVPAPSCWYTHGWLVHRLAALRAWRARAYAPDAHPRDAADWMLLWFVKPSDEIGTVEYRITVGTEPPPIRASSPATHTARRAWDRREVLGMVSEALTDEHWHPLPDLAREFHLDPEQVGEGR